MTRSKPWTLGLWVALGGVLGWLLVPGECVVLPAGHPDALLPGSVLSTLRYPFSVDLDYGVQLISQLSPLVLVILAMLHWRNRFQKLRAPTALFATLLSGIVAMHPYRTFSDTQLIAIIGTWGVLLLTAYQSKASPGAALLALMSLQIALSEFYSGLGPDRGIPFWCLITTVSIVFSYSLFHYTRMLRHSVLGRFTEIRRIDPKAAETRAILLEQRRRLEESGP